MTNALRRVAVTAIWLAGSAFAPANAYEILTHQDLTEAAVDRSVLVTDPTALNNLGLKGVRDKTQQFPNSRQVPQEVLELFRTGADFEDSIYPTVRVTRHFYNPLTGQGLDVWWLPTQTSSPDWALAPRGSDSNQENSYADARQYLYDALTKPAKKDRDTAFGRTFQTLGQVVHHLQDMAQPQHVRNDAHPPGPTHSLYERWTDREEVRGRIAQQFTNPASVAAFNSPRRFWHTEPPGPNSPASGQGMAEFTNANFVSAGSNFGANSTGFTSHPNFALPSPTGVTERKQITDPELLGTNQPLRGEMWFIGTTGKDNLTGQPVPNPRASTYSIFDADLQRYSQTAPFRAVTLNRFNFEATYPHLMPRAVAYSAGLINYFFRGRLEISLPEEGVYSLVDHAVVKDIDQGFTKIKLKLKNTTPDIVDPNGAPFPQHMTGGTLVAVAKYHRNGCYRPDLSGELTQNATIPSGCSVSTYLSGEERISASAKIENVTLNSGPGVVPQAFTFDFSQSPIPINARDVYLQVVYQGTLGGEDGAVAVVTKDISEPTYISHLNSTDYFWVNNAFYRPAAMSTAQKDKIRVLCVDVEQQIAPEPFSVEYRLGSRPLALVTLPPERYSRMAVLTDSAPFTLSTRVSYPSDIYCTFGIPWRNDYDLLNAINQTDKATGAFHYSWIEKTRGLNRFDIITSYKSYVDPAGGYREPTITEINALDPLTDPGPYQMTVDF